MTKFEKRFFHVLQEQDEDREAMLSTLDQDTDPNAFDVSAEGPEDSTNTAVSQAITDRNNQMVSQIKGWISEMESFREKLNGTENSIQTALASAEPDTILDKMKGSEQRKIAKVATDLAALTEAFKGYLSQAGNPNLKYV